MSMKAICAIAGLAFVTIQLIRPAIPHPPVTGDLTAPPEVKRILRTSCYDCHSNETKLAWFDQIAPAYWLVAKDVQQGRSRLNFSTIGTLPAAQQKAALYEAVNQIQLGAMPLAGYMSLHRAAVIASVQLNELKNYLNSSPAVAAGGVAGDSAQYEKWMRSGNSDFVVAPARNGIQFPHDYKNWRAVSSTDRLDNQTMRAILGNDTAVRAIRSGQTNPWPDGTTFAKIAWEARDDGQGQIRPGAFWQVEFMIRDAKKFASTKGWGWARWRGDGLIPYGKDAGFSTECVGCHTPMRDHDYVFTMPLGVKQLPANASEWNVITSSIDRRQSTMTTLYGNSIAVRYARGSSQHDYPPGSELSLVTWAEREDPHWFGANVPGELKSVELVRVAGSTDNKASYSYERYEGSPLVRTSAYEGHSAGGRAAFLLSLRAAVMP